MISGPDEPPSRLLVPILLQNLDSSDLVSQGEHIVAFEKAQNWPSRLAFLTLETGEDCHAVSNFSLLHEKKCLKYFDTV